MEDRDDDRPTGLREVAGERRSGDQALVDLLRDMEHEHERAAGAYRAVVRSLSETLEARDGYTSGHSAAVHDLASAVARRLGVEASAAAHIRTVALLHDIGKVGIPDSVLHKPATLDDEEWTVIRRHPEIGERILQPLPELAETARAVRHEHERWDGGGYPDGLAGETIPLAARIVLVCDAWHALISDRPYRRALDSASARAELIRCSGTQFDPRVVDALLAHLDDPDAPATRERAAVDIPAGPGETRLQAELRALIAVAGRVAAVHSLDEVIETAAEEARAALAAASLSVSRLELDAFRLRTLINVGDLAPGEERRPADEVYGIGDHPRLLRMVERGLARRTDVDDPAADASERAHLRDRGKRAGLAVPIVFADRMWGEIYATRSRDEHPFDELDVRFVQAIAGQIAATVGRIDRYTRMAELAFEDSLTGLANRRALDERLESAVAAALADGSDLALVMCDLDDLKGINDSRGHEAGDAALVRTADVLRETAAERDGIVARLGGDEFCILLARTSAGDARALAESALADLIAEGDGLSISAGVASVGTGARRPADLMRAADGALYTAKRRGRRRVFVARADSPRSERPARERRRRAPVRITADLHRALGEALAHLDTLDLPVLERLSAVMVRLAAVTNARAWALSHAAVGADHVATVHLADLRARPQDDARVAAGEDVYRLADYPETARIVAAGGSFSLNADDPGADPAERSILTAGGMRKMVAAAAPWAGGAWLVELYGDDASVDLALAEPYLRLLTAEAVRGAEERVAAGQPADAGRI